MSSKKDIGPIASNQESSLFFTDAHIEMSGTSTSKNTKIQGLLRKKPWLSQRMNIKGRFGQLALSLAIVFMGIIMGLVFLRVPLKPLALKYLAAHGFRGPYQGLQVIDLDIKHGFDPKSPLLIAKVLVHNFSDQPVDQANIQLSFQKENSENINKNDVQFSIPCCQPSIPAKTKQSITTTITHDLHPEERIQVSISTNM